MTGALQQTESELATAIVGFAQTLYVPIAPAYKPGVPATVAAGVRLQPGGVGSVIFLDGICLANSRPRGEQVVVSRW